MVQLSIALSDFWPGFQGHDIFEDKVTIAQEERIPNIWNGNAWWPWLNSKRVARVCQHQLSFLIVIMCLYGCRLSMFIKPSNLIIWGTIGVHFMFSTVEVCECTQCTLHAIIGQIKLLVRQLPGLPCLFLSMPMNSAADCPIFTSRKIFAVYSCVMGLTWLTKLVKFFIFNIFFSPRLKTVTKRSREIRMSYSSSLHQYDDVNGKWT